VSRITRPTRTLSDRPDLDQLRRQAKDLLDAVRAGDPAAIAEVQAHDGDAALPEFALHDAQRALARAYGFDNWPRLKAHVDGISGRQFVEAARANDLARVEALLRQRPDLVDMQWSYGDERRALHYAVINAAPAMVRLLMRHGANARAGVHPHRDATSARTMAIERELSEIVAIIDAEEQARQTREPQPVADAAAPTPRARHDADVREAVVRGDVDWLRARHAVRPIVNTPDWDGGGLLTLAAEHDQRAVLALLLDFGFDPDERVRWNEGPDAAYSQGYPLWHCAAHGKSELAELLLQRGANANVHVDSSGSPVYAAYSHRQWSIVPLLQRYRGIVTPDIAGIYRETKLAADILTGRTTFPEGTIPKGRTPADYLLEFALSGGAADIVSMALEHIDWPRDDERWFRMLGRGVDFWNHIPWLRSANGDFDRRTYLTAFRALLERCDPNIIGGFNRTALHEVAAAGDHVTDQEAATLARMLLDAGARTNVRDELLNSTPLAWACRWGRTEVVRVMLAYGTSITEQDADAWATPRAWARKMNRDEVLAVLQEQGSS